MARSFLWPVIGQEAIVSGGRHPALGRVIDFKDEYPYCWVEVKTYHDGVQRQYDPRNVSLVDIPLTRRCLK